MSEEEVRLHDRKNHDYAAGGDPLGNFYRVSTILGLYPGIDLSNPAVIPLIFAMKQIDAVLWMHSNKHTAEVEGKVDKLKDISIYTKLSRILEEEGYEKKVKEIVRNIGLEEEKRKAKPLEKPRGLWFGPLEPLKKDVTRINKALFGEPIKTL